MVAVVAVAASMVVEVVLSFPPCASTVATALLTSAIVLTFVTTVLRAMPWAVLVGLAVLGEVVVTAVVRLSDVLAPILVFVVVTVLVVVVSAILVEFAL